ncbi:PEP-CTERM sorting domain-containing protein [Roseateles sp. DB2]|uniref:PEP-CTERM sorting domain-containing protein n=1 Tax=Roseateles sp. DB2 TaxID=3453717 RepID=UPI003EE96AD1
MRKLSTACAALAAFTFSAIPALSSAAPVTMGFEGVADDSGQVVPGTPYTEASYQLVNLAPSPYSDGIFGKYASNSNGSATFVFCAYDSTCYAGTAIKLTGPQPFSLKSIDVGNWERGYLPGSMELIGTLVGGGTVSTMLSTSDLWSSHLLAGFDMLTSVEFRGHGTYAVAFDNLVLDASHSVPEPGSLALLSLAVAGLGLRGRRRAG